MLANLMIEDLYESESGASPGSLVTFVLLSIDLIVQLMRRVVKALEIYIAKS